MDLDADGRREGVRVGTPPTDYNEDGDSDPIFETIAAALTHTSTGGVINIMPGVYREKVSVTDSVTLRGWPGDDVVLQGACLATNGTAIDCTGSNKAITIENLTILGYTTGIDASDNQVRVVNSTIASCVDGIAVSGGSTTTLDLVQSEIRGCSDAAITADIGLIHVIESRLDGNEWGIEYVASGGGGSITVTDSRITRSTAEGIKVSLSNGGLALDVHGGEITSNAGRGVSYVGRNSGAIRLTDVLISTNGSDGVYLENNAGCVTLGTASLKSIASGCRILGNVGDGVELKGSGSSCGVGNQPSATAMSVFGNSIAFNGGYGLNGNSMSGAVVCTLGQNQISYNVSGAENGTAQCTAAGASSNHVP